MPIADMESSFGFPILRISDLNCHWKFRHSSLVLLLDDLLGSIQ